MAQRSFTDDAGKLLLLFAAAKWLGGLGWGSLLPKRDPWWRPEDSDKGGRGAGPGATTTPVPQGGADLWSEDTMKLFAEQMAVAGVTPAVVLLGIAAASNFNADVVMGNNAGLLLVSRDHLREIGYPPNAVAFEALDAPSQIPWIAAVIAYRLADAQGSGEPPDNVGDLAVLLHPSPPAVAALIRAEANRRAAVADGTMIYIAHSNLLRHVIAEWRPMPPGGPQLWFPQ